MRYKDIAGMWPSSSEKVVLRTIPFANDLVAFRETNDGNNSFSHQIPMNCQLVISYYYTKKLFIVWNAAIHHYIHNPTGMTTLSLGANAKDLIEKGIGENSIERSFKPILQRGYKDCVELVILVGVNALGEFCRSYNEYIIPQLNEIPNGKNCLYATVETELNILNSKNKESYQLVERDREHFSRGKRNPSFREKVINRWGDRCIVCGARERSILEAAHVESVGQGGSDDPSNGYCLCANHHRMYDAGIIDILLAENRFECHSEAVKEMSWYTDAVKRNYKLFLPNK